MTHLNLSNLPTTGDYQFAKVSNRCIGVKTLVLCNNPTITEPTMHAILKGGPDLEMVNVNMCGQWDTKAHAAMVADYPQIRIIRHSMRGANPRDDGLRVWLPRKDAKRPGDKKKKKK